MAAALLKTEIDGFPVRRGKVRDIYELDQDSLVIVATDRISAFDHVLPVGIPGKGRLLTEISVFWFDRLDLENHLLSDDIADFPKEFRRHAEQLNGRSLLVRRAKPVPFECVGRAFLTGSAWAEYQQSGRIGGEDAPAGMGENHPLPPTFTPTTKEASGHDQPVTYREFQARCPSAVTLRGLTLDALEQARRFAWAHGLVIADAKFEFGHDGDELMLIDEVLTPDAARYWRVEDYRVGSDIPSLDKQYVRNYLRKVWDGAGPPPGLPDDVVANTLRNYEEVLSRLTGRGARRE